MILFDRINPALAARATQIERNVAALKGGRPYIDLRLWRAPNESDLSWFGTQPSLSQLAGNPKGVVSRRDRACLINDAGRIAGKIGQYLFSKPVTRAGIDLEFSERATAEGLPIDDFWLAVNDALTAGGWCWLQADRGATVNEDGTPRTLADRAESGDRITWRLWPALSVVDWSFGPTGALEWLLTTERAVDNSNPLEEARNVTTRTLWRRDPGGATWEEWRRDKEDNAKAYRAASGRVSSPDIPFALVGNPSADPWWFDDVEIIQAQALNLDSLHSENLIQAVYPQLIIPLSMYEGLEARIIERYGQEGGQPVAELCRELVRGLNNPMVESGEDKGTTRFIQPNAADLQAIPMEEARKRSLLFDQVGLSLFNKESRQVQSAASKQFDHLDTEATLAHRARVLQAAETRLVAISRALDSAFPDYVPEWPQNFNVPDLAADTAALLQLMQMPVLTLTQRKVAAKIATRLEQGFIAISDEDLKAIDQEIEEMAEADIIPFPAPAYEGGGEGEGGEGEGGGEPPGPVVNGFAG